MWSILPNTRRSLCGRLVRGRLGAQDLGHRGEADLELLGARLLGRPEALDLAPGLVESLGKRLTVMINYGAGGPADIEGRIFARHLGKHIDGNPNVIVQNIDGAGGLIGTTYLGEIAPRDGTMLGHLTGMAWRWANDAERFRTDFKTYEFVGYQRSTTVYYVRTDVAPGLALPQWTIDKDAHQPAVPWRWDNQ